MTPLAIRELRKRLRLKQPEFGDLIGIDGSPESRASVVSRWENGKVKPTRTAQILMKLIGELL